MRKAGVSQKLKKTIKGHSKNWSSEPEVFLKLFDQYGQEILTYFTSCKTVDPLQTTALKIMFSTVIFQSLLATFTKILHMIY